jgi:hypothetical protein
LRSELRPALSLLTSLQQESPSSLVRQLLLQLVMLLHRLFRLRDLFRHQVREMKMMKLAVAV